MNKVVLILLMLSSLLLGCKAPQPLEYIGIENFGIRKVGLGMSTLAMKIKIFNPNKYDIKLKEGNLDILIDNKSLGNLHLDSQYILAKASAMSVPVSIQVEMKNLIPNAVSLLLNNEVNVQIKGNIKAGRGKLAIWLPINYSGKQRIEIN